MQNILFLHGRTWRLCDENKIITTKNTDPPLPLSAGIIKVLGAHMIVLTPKYVAPHWEFAILYSGADVLGTLGSNVH